MRKVPAPDKAVSPFKINLFRIYSITFTEMSLLKAKKNLCMVKL